MLKPSTCVRSAIAAIALTAIGTTTGCEQTASTPLLGESHDDSLETTAGAISGGYNDFDTHGVVGLVSFGGGGLGICSGTLIAPNVVLTAQHCIARVSNEVGGGVQCGTTGFGTKYNAQSMRVTTWAQMTQNPESYKQVREIVVPPGSSTFCGNDIALMILSDRVEASEATPITPRVDSALVAETPWVSAAGEGYSAVGYGNVNGAGQGSGQRRRRDNLQVTCVHEQCPAYAVDANEWVGETGVCQGDSGGPAIDEAGRVVGVASRGGANCGTPVYGSVAAWGDWIIEVTTRAANEDGVEPPRWALGWPTDPVYYAPVGGPCENNGDCEGFCSFGECTRACTELATCPFGWSCEGSRCKREPIGDVCGVDEDCTTGMCRDGFCSRGCDDEGPCPDGYSCDGGECRLHPIGEACGGSSECTSGLCVDGYCSRACGDEAPCGPAYLCVEGQCLSLDLGDGCEVAEDCPGGFCEGGQCTKGCVAPSDCPTGYTCDDGGVCQLDALGAECASGDQCPSGVCRDGFCSRGCDDLVTCGPGYTCDAGECALIPVGGLCEAEGSTDGCDNGFCQGGTCTRACSDEAPCPSGYTCGNDGNCVLRRNDASGGCAASGGGSSLPVAVLCVLALLAVARRRDASVDSKC